MAGFPLAAIGAGIGQGVQQIDQHTMAAIQQAVARLALQQQQQQQQAQMLAGSALSGLTGMMRPSPLSPLTGGGLNLPGSTIPPGPPTLTATPGPNGYSVPGAAMPPPAVAPNQSSAGQFDSGDAGYDPGIGDNSAATVVGDNLRHDRSINAPIDLNSDVGPSASAPQTSGQTSAATQMSPQLGDTSTPATTQMQAPITNPSIQSLIGPQVDLGQIVQAIQKARPDADPGTVFRATTMLYEMLEKGNAAQMNTAIRAYTQLRLADQFKQTLPIRQQQADTARQSVEQRGQIAAGVTPSGAPTVAEKSRQDRAAARTATMDQRKAEFEERKRQFIERQKAAEQKGDRAELMRVLTARLSDVDRRLGQLATQVPPPADLKQQTTELQAERTEIIGRMNKRVGIPPTSMPLPGGGATAPLPPQ